MNKCLSKFHMVELATGLMTACVTLASPAAAQTANADTQTAPAAGASNASEFEEIVVTARRVGENLQKVPLAITALSQEALTRQNIVSPADLNAKIPSLGVSNTSPSRDSLKYVIRGQGQAPFGAAPAVVTYISEVPTTSAGPGLLFDLQNVQVLKGPQGTLFGRNTTGGAILIEPKRPVDDFEGFGVASFGKYNSRRFQGALNVPVVEDKLLVRAAVDINRRRGFTQEIVQGQRLDDRHYESYRLGVTFRPNDWLENYTQVYYTHANTNGGSGLIFYIQPGGLIDTVFPTAAARLEQLKALGPRATASDIRQFDKSRYLGVTNVTTAEIGTELTLKNIFGYRQYKHKLQQNQDGLDIPVLDGIETDGWGTGAFSEPSSDQYTNELQLQGKSFGERLNWIVGGYVERTRPITDNDKDALTQFGLKPFIIQSLKYDDSNALFGQGTFKLTPELNITAGLRHTWDKRKQIARNYLGTPAVCTFIVTVPDCTLEASAKFSAFTGNVTIDYRPTDHIMFYVASRRGYKSGGFSITAPNPADRLYRPETVTDIEVGGKVDFKAGSVPVRLNAALYRGWFKNLQISGTAVEPISGQLLAFTTNAGKGYIQGLEFEGSILPVEGLELSGFYAYTDPKYTRAIFAGQDVRNTPFTNVPKHKLGLTGRYEREFGTAGTVAVSANYTYQSRTFFLVPIAPVNLDPQAGQAGYGLLNFRADWTHMFGSNISSGLFMTNVTNKVYKAYENSAVNLIGASYGIYGEPRMYGAEFRIDF